MVDSLDHCDLPPRLLREDMFDSLDQCDLSLKLWREDVFDWLDLIGSHS